MCLTEILVPCAWPTRGPAANFSRAGPPELTNHCWCWIHRVRSCRKRLSPSCVIYKIPYVIVLKHQTIHTSVLNRRQVIWQSKLWRDTGESGGRTRTWAISVWGQTTQGFRQLRTLCCYIYLSEKSQGVTRCCQTDINVIYKGQQLN